MKAVKYDLKTGRAIARKLNLAGRYAMLSYRNDWPEPQILYPNQVKVKTRLGGICGTDLNMISVHLSYFASIFSSHENPSPMGHELVGEVEETGEAVKAMKRGARVVYLPFATCSAYGFDACPACRNGNPQSCACIAGTGDGSEREALFGGHGNFGGLGGGGFGERLVGFDTQFFEVPSSVPDEAAVLAEPFGVGIHAAARNLPSSEQTALIIGAGVIGLMVIAALRAYGSKCRILTVARYDFQAENAARLGSDETIVERDRARLYERIAAATGATLFKPMLQKKAVFGPGGPDVVFDCVATEDSIEDALHLVRSNGRIVVVGESYSVTRKVDWSLQYYKEVELTGAFCYGLEPYEGRRLHAIEAALRFLSGTPALLAGLLTHTFRIEDYRAAFACACRKSPHRAVKVAFDYR
jgi:L-iditol 2-dehydrogenase